MIASGFIMVVAMSLVGQVVSLGEFTLSKEILTNCSRSFRPIINQSAPIVIRVAVYPYQINHINVVDQVLDIVLWVDFYWQNEFVSWEPSHFNDMKRFDFWDDDDVWVPDMVFYNQFAGDEPSQTFKVPGFINSSGYTSLWTTMQAKFACSLDGKYFPFDEHTCVMQIGSWTNTYDLLDVEVGFSSANYMVDNSAWIVKDYRVDYHYVEAVNDYASVKCSLTVKRRSAFYVGTVIVPSIAISYLSLCNFFIPIDTNEKVGFGVTIFLAQVFNMLIASNLMPKGGQELALWGQYLLFCISFDAAALLLTVFLMMIYYHHPSYENRAPGRKSLYKRIMTALFDNQEAATEKEAKEDVYSDGSFHMEKSTEVRNGDLSIGELKRWVEARSRAWGAWAGLVLTAVTLIYLSLAVAGAGGK